MAEGNEFKVIFGADGEELKKTVGELEAELKQFQKQLKTTSGSQALTELNQQIDKTRKNIQILKNVGLGKVELLPKETPQIVNNTATAVTKLRTSSSSAALALTDVSRVAQDLPYGFIGIQNNINPLLDSFTRLKAETGSTKGALKALASSLGGVGGLGLVLGVVSSAFVIFQNGIAGFNKKTKEAKDKTKDFVDTLKEADQVAGEAGAGIYGQIATVKALADVVTNTNRSYKERKNAIEQLKDVNKEHFGDLKLEASSLQTLTGRVNEYTQALIAQAVIKGFGDEIGRVNKELFDQNRALDASKDKVTRAQQALADFGSGTYTDTRGNEVVREGYGKLEAALKNANQEFKEQRDIVEKTDTNLRLLEDGINKATEAAAKFKPINVTDGGKKENVTDPLKEQIELLEKLRTEAGLLKSEEFRLGDLKIQLVLRDGKKEGLSEAQIERVRQSLIEEFRKRETGTFEVPMAIIPRVAVDTEVVQPSLDAFGSDMAARLNQQGIAAGEKFVEGLNTSLGKSIGEILSDAVVPAFAELGIALGNAFNGGGLASAAEGFLALIGDVLQKVGVQVIEASAAVAAMKKALGTLFAAPGGGIVAGIALIAVGQILKNIKFKETKFAQGGLVLGPTRGLIGEAGPELVLPLNQLGNLLGDVGGGGGGNYTFRMHGNDMIAVQDRAQASRNRRGG